MNETRVTYKELKQWTENRAPQEVRRKMQAFWNVNLADPEIVVDASGESCFNHKDKKIHLVARDLNKQFPLPFKFGLYRNFDQGLRGNVAGFLSNATLHQTVSDEVINILYNDAFDRMEPHDLIKAFNISSQHDAVSLIGERVLMRELNPNYTLENETKFYGAVSEEGEAWMGDLVRTIHNNEFLYTRSEKEMPSLKDKDITLLEGIEGNMFSYIITVAGFKVSRVFEEEYSGRLNDLMRQKFDWDPRFDGLVYDTIDSMGSSRAVYRKMGLRI